MPNASSVDLQALHNLRKSRELCFDALMNFKAQSPKSKEDCQRIQGIVKTYVDKVAEPLALVFEKKLERLVPKVNEAVHRYEQASGEVFEQEVLQKALLNQSHDEKLNHLLHPFYQDTVEPKRKLDKEITTLRQITKDIAEMEKKL